MKTISIIIPTVSNSCPPEVIKHIKALEYPSELIEVLHVTGSSPSLQRNQAAEIAMGELLYFLDDDSLVTPAALLEAIELFNRDDVAVVGGPALTYSEASYLEMCFGAALGSAIGTGATRARNRSVGECRRVRGEELILCNLLIRRDVFLANGGLNVELYPNEENEMLKRLRHSGFAFFYSPKMIVKRSQRKTIVQFCKQMFSYGQGRARHIFSKFSLADLPFLVPLAFLVYLISVLFIQNSLYSLPLIAYVFVAALSAIIAAIAHTSFAIAPTVFFTYPLMHISYALGLLAGILKVNQSRSDEATNVEVRRIISGVDSVMESSQKLANFA